jgi:hypothetical protein
VAVEAVRGGLWHPSLRRRFDLIGMDPRGVGTSTPVRCDPAVYNRSVSLFPRSPAQFGRLARYAPRARHGGLAAPTGCALHGQDVPALFDALTQRADQTPIPVPGCAPARCHTPVTGDDIRLAAYNALLFKDPIPAIREPGWNGLAQALAALEAGDASAFAAPMVHSSRARRSPASQ